ncbi:hypothetical protein KRP22_009532 [Phytophthora ramorum]|uniref:uncharacterized protein n=1 Tax=Phytophthora ramorum TaxID=164328 RepID=UPI00309DEBE4|nr:hypothetical protein KRP23_13710 [Phytophthora ramorum]KAH7502905.1 hypothetical protein KRP22_8365 [Phytophthora ramorum]
MDLKSVSNAHTKLLDEEGAELKKETKEFFLTKHVVLLALFVVIWTNIFQAEVVQYLQLRHAEAAYVST